jgi:hypothetical protein
MLKGKIGAKKAVINIVLIVFAYSSEISKSGFSKQLFINL